MSSDDLIPRQRLRAMQIIAGALPAGVVVFFAIVIFLVYGQGNVAPPPQQNLPLVSLMAGAFLIMAGSGSFIMPLFITQTGLKQLAARGGTDDVTQLLNLRQTAMIISMAMLEGAAFFGIVAFLIERQPLVLVVPGVALVGMLLRFPTENSVRNWMELNGRRVLELRQDRAIP